MPLMLSYAAAPRHYDDRHYLRLRHARYACCHTMLPCHLRDGHATPMMPPLIALPRRHAAMLFYDMIIAD